MTDNQNYFLRYRIVYAQILGMSLWRRFQNVRVVLILKEKKKQLSSEEQSCIHLR